MIRHCDEENENNTQSPNHNGELYSLFESDCIYSVSQYNKIVLDEY